MDVRSDARVRPLGSDFDEHGVFVDSDESSSGLSSILTGEVRRNGESSRSVRDETSPRQDHGLLLLGIVQNGANLARSTHSCRLLRSFPTGHPKSIDTSHTSLNSVLWATAVISRRSTRWRRRCNRCRRQDLVTPPLTNPEGRS